MNIIAMSQTLLDVVARLMAHSRNFFYAVMLAGHSCPRCGNRVDMEGEGRCRCRSCGHAFDPTLAFQRCASCGGRPVLRVQRYVCKDCDADVPPRYLFDGLVFDAEYFRRKMAEHRERNRERKERIKKMLMECRSPDLDVPEVIDLNGVAGLVDALDLLGTSAESVIKVSMRDSFDMKRYQAYIEAHIREFPLALDELPSLAEDLRKDRIWRFVTVVFMAHAGLIDIWQDGPDVMVVRHEAH